MTTPPLDDAALDELQRLSDRRMQLGEDDSLLIGRNVLAALLSRIRDDEEKIRRLREALKRSMMGGSDMDRWTDAEIGAIENGNP